MLEIKTDGTFYPTNVKTLERAASLKETLKLYGTIVLIY